MRPQIRELMEQFEDPIVVLHEGSHNWVANRSARQLIERNPPPRESGDDWENYAALLGIRVLRLLEDEGNNSGNAGKQPPRMAARAKILNSFAFRLRLNERLESWTNGLRREMFAVAFFDLSRIRHVIEAFGHAHGYQVLTEATLRIQGELEASDVLAQFTREECAVLLEAVEGPEEAEERVKKILAALAEPYPLGDMQILVSSRSGLSLPRSFHSSVDSILRDADAGLQRARSHHLNVVMVQEQTRPSSPHRLQLEYDLGQAMAEDQFFFEFQPVIDFQTGSIAMIEALLRWQHPRLGVISPASFLEMAEDSGLVLQMDLLGLERLGMYWRRWQSAAQPVRRVPVSINISGRHFPNYAYEEEFHRLLRSEALADCQVAFEITESALVESAPRTLESWERLRKAGVAILLDDFGEGFSSFGYLNQFRVDGIKIPSSIVKNCVEDSRSRGLLQTMRTLARSLDMQLIAEGVETAEQALVLAGLGIQQMQGFFLSRPVAADRIPELLRGGLQVDHLQRA